MHRLIIVPFLLLSCSVSHQTELQDSGVEDVPHLDYASDSAPGCEWVEISRSCINPTTIWVTAISTGCDDPEQDGLTLSIDIPCGQGQACEVIGEGAQCK